MPPKRPLSNPSGPSAKKAASAAYPPPYAPPGYTNHPGHVQHDYQGKSPDKKKGLSGTGYDQGCSLITGANAIQHLNPTALPTVSGRGPARVKEMQDATNAIHTNTVTDQHLHKKGIPVGDVLKHHGYEEYEVTPRSGRYVSPTRFQQMETGTGKNSNGERAVGTLIGTPKRGKGDHIMTVAGFDPTTKDMVINDSLHHKPHNVTYPPTGNFLDVGGKEYKITDTRAIIKKGKYTKDDPFPAKRGGQVISGMNPRKQRRSDW